jgi:ketosteroid isomerase-like protein
VADENVDLIRKGLEAFARRDVSTWLECFDPEVEVREDPSIPDAGSYRGHDGLLRWLSVMERNWEGFQVRGQRFLESGDEVLTLVSVHGRGKGSGIDVDGRFASVFEVNEGRVVRWTIYAGWGAALDAMGLHE